MTREDIFGDLIDLIERSGRDIDTSKLALDDEPFWVHGIDSMVLIRLIGEVEKKFDIELQDSDALIAYSFDKLVDLILERIGVDGEPTGAVDADRINFLDVLIRSAVEAGDRAEVRRRILRGEDVALPQEKLHRIAARLGQGLPEPVDGRRQVALIATMDPLITITGFLAALHAEALPLILPHPKAMGGFTTYYERIHRLAERFGNAPVVLLEPGLLADPDELGDLPVVELPGDVRDAPALEETPRAADRRHGGDDVAFLQMTSASTGDAKLVAITHANVCANLDAMTIDLEMTPGVDRTCSWMPMYHDMGLIGATLFPLYGGFTTILMRTTDFIRDPALWIRTLSEEDVTFSGCPNFGVDYAAKTIAEDDLEGVDLSGVRRFGLAAEPIQYGTVQRWLDRFGPYGFRADAFVPGLGMAESTLSTTTRPGQDPRYVVVDTSGTTLGEKVNVLGEGICTHPAPPSPVLEEHPRGVPVFALGTPLDGLSVHLEDDQGVTLNGDNLVGQICVTGTSVAGYYDTQTSRPVPVPDGVLRTGDLGFVNDGDLFVLERMKNVVIRNGVNHIVSLLEQKVAEILGVPAHEVIVLDEDILDPTSPIHVIVEMANRLDPPDDSQRHELRHLELPIDVITLARGHSLPRTTSGKKRYHVCRQMLLSHGFPSARRVDLR
jgi:acyl-CoA synthetase (AMP-forming)/AMP-acid ligase II/acyl carrier protein